MPKSPPLSTLHRFLIAFMVITALIGLVPLCLNPRSIGSLRFEVVPARTLYSRYAWEKRGDCHVPETYSCTYIQRGITVQVVFLRIVIEQGREVHAR